MAQVYRPRVARRFPGRVARHLAIESVGLCVQPGSLTPELIAGKAGVIDAMGEWLAPESVEDAARILEEMLSGRRRQGRLREEDQ